MNSVAPVISGGTPVGSTLTCTQGTWLNSPTSITFQWKRSGTTNLDADSQYQTVTADIGLAITCVVTATNAIGQASSTSNTITPTAAAGGTVSFQDSFDHDADGLANDFRPPWSTVFRAFADRMVTQTAAEAGFAPRVGTHSLRMRCAETDTSIASGGTWSGDSSIGQPSSTNNARAQLQGPSATYNRAPAETYYHTSVRIPSFTNLQGTSGFALVTQWHGDPFSGSPSFQLDCGGSGTQGRLAMRRGVTGTDVTIWLDTGLPPRDAWMDFTYRIKWSYGSDGFFEMYRNGNILTLTNGTTRWNGATLKSDMTNGVNFYCANYRNAGSVPGFVTYYFDAVKVGNTFAIVQP